MPRLPVFLFVAALALLVAAFAAACGDDGGLSLEEYFSEIEPITDDLVAGRAALQPEVSAARDPGASEEESSAAAQRLFEGTAMIYSAGGHTLGGIDPPAEAEDAHIELAAGFAGVEAECQDAADAAAEVESRSEITELLRGCESVDAFAHVRAPCRALEDLADDNGIHVNLQCP